MRHQLSVFGLGKLGLPLTALFARSGVKTVGIDINSTLIARLKAGDTPYVEPGLAGLLEEVAPTITYTTDAQAAAATDASIILADFVDGEVRYFAERSWDQTLMVPPSEWGNLDYDRARRLVKTLWRYAAGSWPEAQGPGTVSTFYQMAKYLPVATGHTGLLRSAAFLKRLWCRVRLGIAEMSRSKAALACWFNAYQEALVHEGRLRQILRLAPDKVKRPCPNTMDFRQPDSAGAITGFYPIETFAGRDFR